MAESYSGSCHCGAVRYQATTDLSRSLACNCSRCSRLGMIWSFAPAAEFVLDQGEISLTLYKFNKGVIAHQFCRVCGVEPFAYGTAPDGAATVALNVRCLEGVDLDALTPARFDGKSL